MSKKEERSSVCEENTASCVRYGRIRLLFMGRFVSCFFIENLVIFYWVLSLTTIGKWFIMRM